MQNPAKIQSWVCRLTPAIPCIGFAISDSPAAPFTRPVSDVTTIVATTETTSITIA